MEISSITPKLVKDFLDRCRKREILDNHELCELDIVANQRHLAANAEKIEFLEQYLSNVIRDNLYWYRRCESVPIVVAEEDFECSVEKQVDQYREDQQTANKTLNTELSRWSTLYYYYVSRPSLDKHRLATSANVETRTVSNWLYDGINLIVKHLRKQETKLHHRGFRTRNLPVYDDIDPHQLVGREQVIESIITELTHPKGSSIISLEGMGGIGKTAIALAVAHRLQYEDVQDIFLGECAATTYYVEWQDCC